MVNLDSKTIVVDVELREVQRHTMLLTHFHPFASTDSDIGHWNDHPVTRTFRTVEQFEHVIGTIIDMYNALTVEAARTDAVALRASFEHQFKLLAVLGDQIDEIAKEQSIELIPNAHAERASDETGATGTYAENLVTTGFYCKTVACGRNAVARLINVIAAEMHCADQILGTTVWNAFHAARKGMNEVTQA